MKYKVLFLASMAILGAASLKAQLNVGSASAPDASAVLQATSTTKGFLGPKIALLSATDVTTIATPATGLLIYNTATAGSAPNNVVPNYYLFNGTIWTPFSTGVNPNNIYTSNGTLSGARTVTLGTNTLTFASPSASVAIASGNLSATGTGTFTGNLTANYLTSNTGITTSTLNASGNGIFSGSLTANYLTSSTGITSGTINATGNGIFSGNLTANYLTSTTGITTNTLNASGNGVFSGNLTANYLTSTTGITTNTINASGNIAGNNIFSNAQSAGGNRYAYFDNSGQLTGGVGYPSDMRLKTNVIEIDNGLQKVMALRPVAYDWKKDAQMNDHRQIGFIAQELKKIVPEVVYIENRNGYKDLNTINYEQLAALLTKAIQELNGTVITQVALTNKQNAEIASLKKANVEIVAQNATITAQLADMKDMKLAMAAMRSELNKVVAVKVAASNIASK